MKKDFIERLHYYLENGKIVFTEQYHIDRGFCCSNGNGCRHCPYEPKHIKGNKQLKDAINNTITDNSDFIT
jgi:hypothetical protein